MEGQGPAIEAIPDDAWTDIGYTPDGQAQVAETTYTGGGRRRSHRRTVRLVVRRTQLADTKQQRMWPGWRHHAFITNTDHDTVAADEFHREHAVVELAIHELKTGTGLKHTPSGVFQANAAWLACAVLAHNLNRWTLTLADQPKINHVTIRTRLWALAAVLVNRSGRHTLGLPANWPFADLFDQTLDAVRALPQPSG